ncbi:MAG: isoprenoid biosynthesis glyoxalase ElbB [Bdellovibrio sp.]|nr:isoprenoid biosynthesis glyoxalase ElbB [Bdellovibrio sp.]
MSKPSKISVVLCGSGFKDGSEIRESVAALWALSNKNIAFQCFAPDAPQADVINCYTQKTDPQTRNMLIEAARIARGDIKPLNQLNHDEFQGIVIPGGFGVAKNLCSFAKEGSKGSVRPDLQKILEEFHYQKKPIGAICIAPALIALAFKNKHFCLTVGKTCEVSQEIERLGHKHKECATESCIVDAQNKIVTTPAYMDDNASLAQVFQGIEKLVAEVINLTL